MEYKYSSTGMPLSEANIETMLGRLARVDNEVLLTCSIRLYGDAQMLVNHLNKKFKGIRWNLSVVPAKFAGDCFWMLSTGNDMAYSFGDGYARVEDFNQDIKDYP